MKMLGLSLLAPFLGENAQKMSIERRKSRGYDVFCGRLVTAASFQNLPPARISCLDLLTPRGHREKNVLGAWSTRLSHYSQSRQGHRPFLPGMSSATAPAYSARDIIDRYESEEDEFVRELEEMRRNLQQKEQEEVPQDPAPILSVLCSLVDEIGSLRSENRHLKTRLAPSPGRAKNMVQRMSAIFDSRGSSIIPKLRRPAHAEIRTGARERLSTPPRKDCLTTSSILTDFSDPRNRAPPLVEPEMSDSDIDENVFSEDQQDYSRLSRRGAPRRCEMSLSECTSPSSASSSREPSEAMTTSRSSFFEIFGFKKRRGVEVATSPLPPTAKPILKKKMKRRISQEETTLHYTSSDMFHQARRPPATKPPRPASYYPREDSEDSDHLRARKAASFLDVHAPRNSGAGRVDWETRIRHEKESFLAQLEEMKRLVEQLREKSSQFSKLQVHTNKLEEQLDNFLKQQNFNDKVDKMTLDERIVKVPGAILEKVEERLRQFESAVRTCRNEITSNCQKALNTNAQERVAYQTCLEQLDRLQKENFTLMKSHYLDESSLEPTLRRKLELLPSYEGLYSLTTRAVQKISELRWTLMEKTAELGKCEVSLVQTKAGQLLCTTQLEKMRLKIKSEWKKPKRPSSFHGEFAHSRLKPPEIKELHLSQYRVNSVDRMRKMARMKSIESQIQAIEREFLTVIGKDERESGIPKRGGEQPHRPETRIEHMMREMGRQKVKTPYSPVLEKKESDRRNRPISMAEIEEEMRQRIYEERRNNNNRSKETSELNRKPSLRAVVSSVQDIHESMSPSSTPIVARRVLVADRMASRIGGDRIPRPRRGIERGFSTDSGQVDVNAEEAKLRQEHQRQMHVEEKRKSLSIAGSGRIQRSMPVQVSQIRPPSQLTHLRSGTIPQNRLEPPSASPHRAEELPRDPKNIVRPPARSWLEKIRAMKKN